MTPRRGGLLVGLLGLAVAWPVAATAAPSPTPSPASAPRTVPLRVTMQEYRFTPSSIALRSGDLVRLEIHNQGTVTHQFRSRIFRGVDVYVRTPGFDTRSERMEVIYVRPGATAVIEFIRRTHGEYDYWCSATTEGRRHRDLGMQGTFVVAPAGP